MSLLHKTIEYREYNINISHQDNAESPREWSNLGTFYTAHRRYCPEEDFDKHFEFDEVCDSLPGVFKAEFLKKYVALNIYLYDHSGQTVSTTPFSCRWDSGWFGMVAISLEDVRKEYGWKNITKKRRERIEEHLRGEVETYDNYLTGEVYGFTITPVDDELEEIDSCWGYYGSNAPEEIEKECMSTIDGIYAEKAKGTRIKIAENAYAYLKQLLIPFPDFDLGLTDK